MPNPLLNRKAATSTVPQASRAAKKQAADICQLINKFHNFSQSKAALSGSVAAADSSPYSHHTSTGARITVEQIEAENQWLVNEELEHYIHDGVLSDKELDNFDLCWY